MSNKDSNIRRHPSPRLLLSYGSIHLGTLAARGSSSSGNRSPSDVKAPSTNIPSRTTQEASRTIAHPPLYLDRNMSMPTLEKDGAAKSSAEPVDGSTTYQRSGFYDNADGDMAGDDASLSAGSQDTDEAALARLGYKSEMMREFGNLSTFSFAFSIMGMCSSIATTFNTPLLYGGGPASVVWCWLIGSIFNTTLGASVAEIVSAYPTSGGVYTVSINVRKRCL